MTRFARYIWDHPSVIWPFLLAGLILSPIAGLCFGVAKAVGW